MNYPKYLIFTHTSNPNPIYQFETADQVTAFLVLKHAQHEGENIHTVLKLGQAPIPGHPSQSLFTSYHYQPYKITHQNVKVTLTNES
jgi:hypothetical protein